MPKKEDIDQSVHHRFMHFGPQMIFRSATARKLMHRHTHRRGGHDDSESGTKESTLMTVARRADIDRQRPDRRG